MPRIKLTKGKYATVSPEDLERVKQFNWCAGTKRSAKNYVAMRRLLKSDGLGVGFQTLAEFILGKVEGKLIRHLDSNPLNCTRENLAHTTVTLSHGRRRKSRNCSSRYKGVCYLRRTKRWFAYVSYEHKRYNLGSFSEEREAALAYNKAAAKLFGGFARLNEVK